MQRLVMGGNAALRTTRFDLTIDWPTRNGTIDTSAYMLAANGRVRDDHDMIFYNQRSDRAGSIRIADVAADRTRYTIDLLAVPAEIQRIVFCATIETPGRTMSAFDGTGTRISANGDDLLGFYPELRDAREVAMRMVELYRRNGEWKIRADGQGFNDGLAALARSFGIDVAEDEAPPPKSDPAQVKAYAPAPVSESMEAPVRHGKPMPPPTHVAPASTARATPLSGAAPSPGSGLIRLDADNPRFVWPKPVSGHLGPLEARIDWSSQSGGHTGRARPLELSLGCLYHLQDGRSGVVQTWDFRGHFDQAPYVQLLSAEGEAPQGRQKVRINGERATQIRRLALFAFIRGAPNWRATRIEFGLTGSAQSLPGGSPPSLSIALDQGTNGNGLVALVQLDFEDAGVAVRRLSHYYPSHSEFAGELGWQLQWAANPRLHQPSQQG